MTEQASQHQPQSHKQAGQQPLRLFNLVGPTHRFQQLSIAQKIYWGYGITLGIAVMGVLMGLVVGDHVHREAEKQLNGATQRTQLMARLLSLSSQFQPQREFIPVQENRDRLVRAKAAFEQRVVTVEQLLDEIAQSATQSTASSTRVFLAAYRPVFAEYVARQQQLLKTVTSETTEHNWTATERAEWLEREVYDFIARPEAVRFFRYSNEITSLLETAHQDNIAAEKAFAQANALRTQLILGSILFSVLLATILAFFTGQAIIQPIRQVTTIARQVTKTGDFNQRAPDLPGSSETAVLSSALNQLIRWVDEYTRELQQTQTQLIQTEKMSSLGQMVAGIAHEINNPVSFIAGNLPHVQSYAEDLLDLIQLYNESVPHPSSEITDLVEDIDLDFLKEDLPKTLKSMAIGVERIAQIVLSLRNFSRIDESAVKEIDVHEGIDNTLVLLNNRLKHNVDVIKEYGELPSIECYPAQLNQVFMNLLTNAIDALMDCSCTEVKRIKIQTRSQSNTISIAIKDNGMGIPEDLKSKLFDPFFTTKPIGKGTGLGLAVCYQIVKKHNGRIELESQVNQGTSFTVILPKKINKN